MFVIVLYLKEYQLGGGGGGRVMDVRTCFAYSRAEVFEKEYADCLSSIQLYRGP